MPQSNSFGAASTLTVGGSQYRYYALEALAKRGVNVSRIPYSIKILLENLLRTENGATVKASDIEYVAAWKIGAQAQEINFSPARVLLQDFTGVPCVVDLAAMRDALRAMGSDPKRANPLIPADLVIDHSVQVDEYGTAAAFGVNALLEFQRNQERYAFLRWGQKAFQDFRVVPPDTGIVHQVNLEYLAPVIFTDRKQSPVLAYPDTLVGTDSHTTMINGLGVVGWGVGGIEAEACMLGQPISMLLPEVVGFKLKGKLTEGCTATDLVLTVTQMLRKKGVVGKFVEFYGPGVAALPLADRATIGNMAPEYGATIGFFPIDHQTLDYLRLTNRPPDLVALVEAYSKAQGLFLSEDSPEPEYSDTLELDLASVVPSLAGPKRPQDRINLPDVKKNFLASLPAAPRTADIGVNGSKATIQDGSVVIAAITSCTNTSNPSVMVAAGLLAKKAVEKGLKSKPWVKTSLAPGSRVVTDYFNKAGLTQYLDQLGFNTVGYGCTTCIGNSGPLPEAIGKAVESRDLVVAAVLSGNRNFEGRVNSEVRANYLMSPPLVVAYALVGNIEHNFDTQPIGKDKQGAPVYLKDIWPSQEEVNNTIASAIDSEIFSKEYATVTDGDKNWQNLKFPTGDTYQWERDSTYIRKAPYFDGMPAKPAAVGDIKGARVLAVLGDSVTTDHISPAGSIKLNGPAGKYLVDHGVKPVDFNSYGSRRGNHEVMVRGTFANVRLRNKLAPGTEGGVTRLLPEGEGMSIFDASVKYAERGIPLVILAGKEYGSGSSRDWAAKGPKLLGVRAVIAESYERIHRSNLVGMGILPLQYVEGQSVESPGLTGEEVFDLEGIRQMLEQKFAQGRTLTVKTTDAKGVKGQFNATVRIDTPQEILYYENGGILQFVLRQLAAS